VNGRSEAIVPTEAIVLIEVFDRTEVTGGIARTGLVAQIEAIVQTEVSIVDRDKADVRGGRINGAIDAKARNARKHSRNLNLSLSRRRQSHPLRRSCRQ
jgi:ribulose kinase